MSAGRVGLVASEPLQRWSLALVLGGLSVGLVTVVAGGWSVARLENSERDLVSRRHVAALDGAVVDSLLDKGDWVRFEVCLDRSPVEAWEGLEFRATHDQEVVFERSLTEAAQFGSSSDRPRACVLLGQSTESGLPESGRYALMSVGAPVPPKAATKAAYVARIVTRRPKGLWLRVSPWVTFLVIWFVIVGLSLRVQTTPEGGLPVSRPFLRVALSISLLELAVAVLPALLPVASLAVLVQGVAFAGIQTAFAASSRVFGSSVSSEPGELRRRWFQTLLVAPVVGLVLVALGSFLAQSVPLREVAPIHAFLARPSGSAVAAIVAMLAPLAEESFFRGHVYGLIASRAGNGWLGWSAHLRSRSCTCHSIGKHGTLLSRSS